MGVVGDQDTKHLNCNTKRIVFSVVFLTNEKSKLFFPKMISYYNRVRGVLIRWKYSGCVTAKCVLESEVIQFTSKRKFKIKLGSASRHMPVKMEYFKHWLWCLHDLTTEKKQ